MLRCFSISQGNNDPYNNFVSSVRSGKWLHVSNWLPDVFICCGSKWELENYFQLFIRFLVHSCGSCHWRGVFLELVISCFIVVMFPVNTLRPRQDGCHFADDIFTCNFFNENCCILIKFSLKYVHKGPIDNNPALVQITAWRRSGDKPLCEPMMISLPTHICVTRPQWVNSGK